MRTICTWIMVAILAAIAPLAVADVNVAAVSQAGWDNLSPTQKAELIKNIADMQPNSKKSIDADDSKTSAQKAEEWVSVGVHVGQMLGGAAKEVGMAANEFAKTPVGITAMAVAVWHYMGSDVVRVVTHLLAAWAVLMITISLIFIYVRRSREVTIVYDQERTNWFGNHPVLRHDIGPMSEQAGVIAVIVGLIGCIITTIVLVTA